VAYLPFVWDPNRRARMRIEAKQELSMAAGSPGGKQIAK